MQQLFMDTVKCHMAEILRGTASSKLHSHPSHELQYVVRGEGILFREGTGEEKMKAGMLFITPPGILHRTQASESMIRIYADIEIPPGILNPSILTLDTGQDSLLCRWFEDLRLLSRQGGRDEAAAVAALVLLRISGFEHKKNIENTLHPLVRRAVNYIDLHFHEHLDIHQLAKQTGCSASYLHALFCRDFGCGPMHCLNRRRINRAKDLLLSAEFLSVGEIADKCGFSDPDYFCRKFKQETGMTPSDYRRKNRSTDRTND